MKMTDVLRKGNFTLSAEVIPPRNGAEQAQVLLQIEALIQAGAQFLAVTKGAGGSLRGGSLPISQTIKERFGVPCIAHFTCRDLVPEEVENQLMDHHYFGIRNILALRGDPPTGQPEWTARAGGIYLTRPKGPAAGAQEVTDFCIGAAVYPEWPDERERLLYFKRKVEAGAQYAITNMLFDSELYGRFLDLSAKDGVSVPVLPGTRILKSKKQAERMIGKFKVPIPREYLNFLPEVEDESSLERGVAVFMKFAEKLKAHGAPGIHLYVITDTDGARVALKYLAEAEKEDKQ
jgi:methylenetetrahydrofolate reductase (NADPH)